MTTSAPVSASGQPPSKRFARKLLVLSLVFVGIAVAAWFAERNIAEGIDTGRWYSVLPPLFAVTFAALTGRILTSLLLALLLGGLLNQVPGDPASLSAWARGVDDSFEFVGLVIADVENQKLLIFITLALMMISVVISAGGLQAVVNWISRFARGPKSTQLVTFFLGLIIFIDDYANTMIVGSSMRPLADRYKISREKLAFLVDATSAPDAGLAILSTWVSYEVGLFAEQAQALGIEKNGYAMLFDALMFRYYCILLIVFMAINIISGKEFGSMRRAERRARLTGLLAEPDAVPMTSDTFANEEAAPTARVHFITAFIPIGALFGILVFGIWFDGGGWPAFQADPSTLYSLTGWRDVISASENSVKILAYGSGISLLLALICAKGIARLDNRTIRNAAFSGARSSLLPLLILTLALGLKVSSDTLQTGTFLVHAVGESVPPVLFPAIIFVIATMVSFATGTAFGTMAILIPTAVPLAFALDGNTYGLITMITLGSVLDGAIVGDHCSPMSDTTIMSSISTSCDHMHHVRTQLPYSLTVATIALVFGYVPAAFGVPTWVCLLTATAAMIVGFFFLPKLLAESGKEDLASTTAEAK